MKYFRILVVAILFYLIPQFGHSQVIISLLFGEALNSEKVEFGLAGGFNYSYFRDNAEANALRNFNLGFYFHLLMKNKSYLSTGVMVKSSVGASGMSTYPIGDEDFDNIYENGSLTTRINTFYVPILYHLRLNRWYLEAGPMLGLRTKAYDIFQTKINDGDLEYRLNVSDQYTRLDAGFMGGFGYKFRKQTKSVSAGASYYLGLVNVSKVPGETVRNSSLYLFIRIPIGAGKTTKDEPIKEG